MTRYIIDDIKQYQKIAELGIPYNTILWLDDIRDPKEFLPKDVYDNSYVIWTKNYYDFLFWIKDGKYSKFDIICMDHDLGEEYTGYDCAKALVEEIRKYRQDIKSIIVHTNNPVGRDNILHELENAYKECH